MKYNYLLYAVCQWLHGSFFAFMYDFFVRLHNHLSCPLSIYPSIHPSIHPTSHPSSIRLCFTRPLILQSPPLPQSQPIWYDPILSYPITFDPILSYLIPSHLTWTKQNSNTSHTYNFDCFVQVSSSLSTLIKSLQTLSYPAKHFWDTLLSYDEMSNWTTRSGVTVPSATSWHVPSFFMARTNAFMSKGFRSTLLTPQLKKWVTSDGRPD